MKSELDDLGLYQMHQHVDNGTYFCNYPEDPDTSKIVTGSQWYRLYSETKGNYKLLLQGDIITDFLIIGTVGKIVVKIKSEKAVYEKVFYNCLGDLKVKPFISGIPLTIRQLPIILEVYGMFTGVNARYLYLNLEDRRKMYKLFSPVFKPIV